MTTYTYLYIIHIVIGLSLVNGQLRKSARWCVINDEEHQKCQDLVAAIATREDLGAGYPEGIPPYADLPELMCVRADDPFECMSMVNENEADLVQYDPGMGYTAGEYYNLMPLMYERYATGTIDVGSTYKAVAVVRKNRDDITIDNLAGKIACHTGVGRAAGWVYPISTLINEEHMPIVECNVPVKSAASYFGDMCAPNALTRYYNPFGNNPVTVCRYCAGDQETACTSNDPYAGYFGAFNCMATGGGDVAFVRDTTVYQYVSRRNTTATEDDFELLCVDGTRAPVASFQSCNWGEISSHIVMSSAMRDQLTRTEYKQLLALLSYDFGEEGMHKDIFEVFHSENYGRMNLMFTDATMELQDVGSRDTYYSWVAISQIYSGTSPFLFREDYRNRLLDLNTCPLKQARWCVVSRHEMEKCEDMIMAFAAKNLKPDLNCILGTSHRDCMYKISMGDADMITLDAADVYVAGKHYGLVPIVAEDYSGYAVVEEDSWTSPKYFAVAAARRTEAQLTIFNQKDRRSCHSAVMTAAGWVIPVDKLIETGQIDVHNRNPYFAVGQFFSKSCVPGVLEEQYNTFGTNPINLCEACASGGQDRCERTSEELYYGNSGAFRCLVEFGGDIAYIKHTTVRENTDGRNEAEWARNRRSDDYELLCNDGTRADIDTWEDCNMGELPANAVVTADFKTTDQKEIFWTLLNYGQQFFASDSNEDFPMFVSMLNHKDLIFQDSTMRLVQVPGSYQNYKDYLETEFVRAMERMENIDKVTAAAPALFHHSNGASVVLSVMLCFVTVLLWQRPHVLS